MDSDDPDAFLSDNPDNTWRLVLAYDGSDFQGWQVQPGLRTVQGTLAETLMQTFGESRLPQGSGRTDTGVHADGQVVSLRLRVRIEPERLVRVLNRRLPSAIRVLSAERMNASFHARACVRSKTYEYRIFEALTGERVCPPTLARYVWDCRWALDVAALQAASARVVGTHDFTSFAAADPDRAHRMRERFAEKDANVRSIYRSFWSRSEDLLTYEICGNGFLHHMVRNLVGTFVEIGRGRMKPGDVENILQAENRAAAGPTAPPQGLFLMKVEYQGSTMESASDAVFSR